AFRTLLAPRSPRQPWKRAGWCRPRPFLQPTLRRGSRKAPFGIGRVAILYHRASVSSRVLCPSGAAPRGPRSHRALARCESRRSRRERHAIPQPRAPRAVSVGPAPRHGRGGAVNQPRRLAAILAADVAGYSRLMGVDEAGTARMLRERRAAAEPLLAEHGGRIVKTAGDGMLIEFGSVVNA